MTDIYNTGRLTWQCRRGIKEVEVILLPYFDRFFKDAPDREKKLFVQLLESQDPDLFEWFTQRSVPEDKDLAEIVGIVLQKLATRS
ncbi:MAG: succinate dehydrogenase assembly factor 2 [Pseudomonadales bacterium]|nr:succinate dehydrogenase assembly factor 2 [Pseudomonadales bacterium]